MGKKQPKKNSKRHKEESEGSDDDESVYTADTRKEERAVAAAEELNLSIEEKFDDSLALLSEKRGASRLAGLKGLTEVTRAYFCEELIIPRCAEMVQLLLRCGKNDSDLESIAAAECLSVIGITLGPEIKSQLSQIWQSLSPGIKFDGCPTKVRCAELRCLTMICFVADESDEWAPKLMSLLTDILCDEEEPQLIAEALCSLSTLATSYSVHHILATLQRDFLHLVTSALESPAVETRVAAANVIALFAEAAQQLMQASSDEEDESEAAPPVAMGRDRGVSMDESEPDEDYDAVAISDNEELVAQLKALMKDCDKHTSKKDRALQRAALRKVLATVEESERPRETFKLQQCEVTLEGWISVLQMAAIRQALGGGLQPHLQGNAWVRDVFGIDDSLVPPPKMTAEEKRHYTSEIGKARDLDRKKRRAGNHKAAAAF